MPGALARARTAGLFPLALRSAPPAPACSPAAARRRALCACPPTRAPLPPPPPPPPGDRVDSAAWLGRVAGVDVVDILAEAAALLQ